MGLRRLSDPECHARAAPRGSLSDPKGRQGDSAGRVREVLVSRQPQWLQGRFSAHQATSISNRSTRWISRTVATSWAYRAARTRCAPITRGAYLNDESSFQPDAGECLQRGHFCGKRQDHFQFLRRARLVRRCPSRHHPQHRGLNHARHRRFAEDQRNARRRTRWKSAPA